MVKYCLLLRPRCEEKPDENAYRILMGSLSEPFNCSDVTRQPSKEFFNPLNAGLNPICHLLALLGAHHIFHISGLRVNHSPGTRNNKIVPSLRSLHCGCSMASSKATSPESAI